jgi:hypothetical protein
VLQILFFFQSSSSSYDSAIIGEAHGLITDMLADTNLPPHVISGLRAVSNLLKPAEHHSSMHKTRVSPLVSLTESTSYGSDSEENPYTGERPSSLPKVGLHSFLGICHIFGDISCLLKSTCSEPWQNIETCDIQSSLRDSSAFFVGNEK